MASADICRRRAQKRLTLTQVHIFFFFSSRSSIAVAMASPRAWAKQTQYPDWSYCVQYPGIYNDLYGIDDANWRFCKQENREKIHTDWWNPSIKFDQLQKSERNASIFHDFREQTTGLDPWTFDFFFRPVRAAFDNHGFGPANASFRQFAQDSGPGKFPLPFFFLSFAVFFLASCIHYILYHSVFMQDSHSRLDTNVCEDDWQTHHHRTVFPRPLFPRQAPHNLYKDW